jgi:hypothetical protein
MEQLIRLLEQEQATYALNALKGPNNGTEFEYGVRSGIVMGYQLVINRFYEMLKEKDDE